MKLLRLLGNPLDAAAFGGLVLLAAVVLCYSAGGNPTLSVLAAIAAAPILLLAAAAWACAPEPFPCSRHIRVAAALSFLALILSVAITQWPFRLAFELSRPSLERLAERVEAGYLPSAPMQAGRFRVLKATVHPSGVTCLWLDLDPAGYTGLVRCDRVKAGSSLSLWSAYGLGPEWTLVSED